MPQLLFTLVVIALVSLAVAHQHPSPLPPHRHPSRPPRPACSRDLDCNAYSTSPLYVKCVSGKCQCLNAQGFSGNATAGNKCRCDPGKQVLLGTGGKFYCLDVPTAVQAVDAQANCQTNKDVIHALYSALIWHDDVDNPLPWIYSALGLPSTKNIYDIFDPAGKLRVVPFGTFPSPVDAVLYYLVFAITNTQVADVYFPYLYCEDNYTYVRADIGFGFEGVVYLNITEVGTYTMTETNKVLSGDAYAISIGTVTAPEVADQEAFIQGLCADLTINPGLWANTTQQTGSCSSFYDPDGYYTDFDDCVTFMHSIDFGTYWNADQGSVVCRAIHSSMSFWYPEEHCKHAGKTGGGVCVDTAYQTFFQQNFKKRNGDVSTSLFNNQFSKLVQNTPPSSWTREPPLFPDDSSSSSSN